MFKYLLVFKLLFLCSVSFSATNYENLMNINRLDKFSFGSCNREYEEQVVWPLLTKRSPQLFVWGGDNIYGDKEPNKDNLKLKYKIQNEHEPYKNFKEKTAIIGIWDDHDFGLNNSGAEYPLKDKNKELLLDFLDVPKNSPVWGHEGIYQSFVFGQPPTQVKFILLDNRYNLNKDTILGKTQWEWLVKQIESSQAQLNFIVGGLAILPDIAVKKGQWSQYPRERERLINLIKKNNLPGVVFLTGDKHFSGITEKYDFVEVMSSGMTHTKTNPIIKAYLKTKFKQAFFKKSASTIEILWDKNPLQLKVWFDSKKKSKLSLFEMKPETEQFFLKTTK